METSALEHDVISGLLPERLTVRIRRVRLGLDQPYGLKVPLEYVRLQNEEGTNDERIMRQSVHHRQ